MFLNAGNEETKMKELKVMERFKFMVNFIALEINKHMSYKDLNIMLIYMNKWFMKFCLLFTITRILDSKVGQFKASMKTTHIINLLYPIFKINLPGLLCR